MVAPKVVVALVPKCLLVCHCLILCLSFFIVFLLHPAHDLRGAVCLCRPPFRVSHRPAERRPLYGGVARPLRAAEAPRTGYVEAVSADTVAVLTTECVPLPCAACPPRRLGPPLSVSELWNKYTLSSSYLVSYLAAFSCFGEGCALSASSSRLATGSASPTLPSSTIRTGDTTTTSIPATPTISGAGGRSSLSALACRCCGSTGCACSAWPSNSRCSTFDARTPLPPRSPLGVGTVARQPAVQAGSLTPLPPALPEAGAVRPAVPPFPCRAVRRLVG